MRVNCNVFQNQISVLEGEQLENVKICFLFYILHIFPLIVIKQNILHHLVMFRNNPDIYMRWFPQFLRENCSDVVEYFLEIVPSIKFVPDVGGVLIKCQYRLKCYT